MKRGGTSALLQKVTAQLRGERVPKPQAQQDEEELGAYLSGLNRKVSKQPQWDKFGEGSDISLSDDNASTKKVIASADSKFLKKKTEKDEKPAKGTTYSAATRSQFGVSSALNKAAAFQAKYSKPQKRASLTNVLSDSDLDLDLSLDEDVLASVPKAKQTDLIKYVTPSPKYTNEPSSPTQNIYARTKTTERPKTSTGHKSFSNFVMSEDSISLSLEQNNNFSKKKSALESDEDSVPLGRGGNKFLKKKPSPEAPVVPVKKVESKPAEKKNSYYELESAKKHQTQVVLDTDEESLADFIQGLSSSSGHTVSPPKTPRTPGSARRPKVTAKKPASIESSRLSPVQIHNMSDDEIPTDDDFIKTDNNFQLNIIDYQDLEPVELTTKPTKTDKSSRKEKTKLSPANEKQTKPGKRTHKKDKTENDVLKTFGLQTLDDLDFNDEFEMSEVVSGQSEEDIRTSSPGPLKSILASSSRPLTPKSSRSRVRYSVDELKNLRSRSASPDPISTARQVESVIYTEDFDDHTETIKTLATDSDSQTYTTASSRSSSPVRKDSHRSVDYTEDFKRSDDSSTHSDHSDSSYSATYTSYSDDSHSTNTRSPSPVVHRKVKTHTIETQTLPEPGLWYHWNLERGSAAIVSQQYGLADVDPTPIATHTVSADALEAMTAYSPSVLAMNDMLRQQLAMTRHFIENHKRLHQIYTGSLTPDYNYTTLEDTKKYMEKHRKPKLTFEEALRQVKEDMGMT